MRNELLLDTSLALRMKVLDLHQLFGYLVHEILFIDGESYRVHEATECAGRKQAGKKRAKTS